ncbi:hypothetical protein QVD17_39914 [Tagetes erecta]|uniref:Uncharacterized protein n=1 Tax=Tagetes erecta TaxID=13708 RepID=A0AAD8JPF3_TARER|nr:hypothetical protein QVD17_39914 [Tagetes erecta]
MSSSKRKRGPASMSKNIPTEKIKLLRFTKDGQPCGSMAQKFKTWYSIKLKRNFSYHIPMSNFPTEDFDILWLQAKAYWMIETDAPKEFMKKWSKKIGTNWRSKLYTKFVKLKKNACDTYSYLDRDHWNDFVAQKSTAEFKEIKATNEYELTDFVIEIGADLFRVEKEMMADGSYAQNKDDPLVRVVGPEHGGSSRTVSHLIGKTKLAPVMESSHGSWICTIDSPPMQDEENTFSSGYMPDMNDVNAGSEEMDMHDVNAELQGTFGGNIGDLLAQVLCFWSWQVKDLVQVKATLVIEQRR